MGARIISTAVRDADKTREALVAELERLRAEVVDLSARAVADARALAAEDLNAEPPGDEHGRCRTVAIRADGLPSVHLIIVGDARRQLRILPRIPKPRPI